MNWELGMGLLGAAASLAGLAWNRESARKLALGFLALLAATMAGREFLHQRRVEQLQQQILSHLRDSVMSADQIYDSVSDGGRVPRLLFDDALSDAVEHQRLKEQPLEFRRPDDSIIKVRVFGPLTGIVGVH